MRIFQLTLQDLFLPIGFLMVRNNARTDKDFGIFFEILTHCSSYTMPWLLGLGFQSVPFCSWLTTQYQNKSLVPCVGILWVGIFLKPFDMDEVLYSESYLVAETSMISCTQVATETFFLRKYWIKKLSIRCLHWNFDTPKCCWRGLNSIFKILFLKRPDFVLPFEVFFWNYQFSLDYSIKKDFLTCRIILWVLMNHKCQKVLLVLTCLNFGTDNFSTLPISISILVSIESSSGRAYYVFLTSIKNVL